MHRRDFVISMLASTPIVSVSRLSRSQQPIEFDLAKLAANNGLKVLNNHSVSVLNEGTVKGVRLGEAPGEGVVYVEGLEFSQGSIELDIRGKDVPQQSFLGVAFHGVDATTYDAIYFRPFNFKTEDPTRHAHAVQYISHPTYTWQKLRTEHPGQYEQPVTPAPDPNGWFHARVVVASPKVSVFVNDAKAPSLMVDQLSDRKKGRLGLWVGNTSGGDFARLRVVPS